MDPLQPHTKDHGIDLPPDRLRYKVAGTDHAEWFDKSGRMSVLDLAHALGSIGRSFDEFQDVLEWGCGCGRILRHLPKPIAPKRIYGNDIDQEAISWLNEHLPWVETSITDGLPPLPYPDNSFDLIFNHSVMTHLDVKYQDAWLAELRRVLRPGGILTLTVAGPNAVQMFLDTHPVDSPVRETYAEDLHNNGILYISQDQWTNDFPDFYHTTFHDVGYVFNHWSKFLDLRSYIPRGSLDYQDMVVLQKSSLDVVQAREYQEYVSSHRPAQMTELRAVIADLRHEAEATSLNTHRAVEDLAQETAARTNDQALAASKLEVLIRERDEALQAMSFEQARWQGEQRVLAEELRQQMGNLRRQQVFLENVELRLHCVYASRSWLLTKPWRALGRFVKRRST